MGVYETKLRTLYVMRILAENTDQDHILNATDICKLLEQQYQIHADRRTIYGEIEALRMFGVDIIQQKGKASGYYIGERSFEFPELKLLVDSVQSSKFITEKKSRELIFKLEKLCSTFQAEQLAKQVTILNRLKTENEEIYYSVDKIHSAIYNNKKIQFQYAEWTPKKELRFRKNGMFYKISPWVLTWDDEKYYLIAFDDVAGKVKHYRVDKMKHLDICEEDREGQKQFEKFDPSELTKKTFGMYGGMEIGVKLLCHNSLAGVILDRFGKDVWMRTVDENQFIVHVNVVVSPQFFGWITGVGAHVKIVEPMEVREAYRKYLETILEGYRV